MKEFVGNLNVQTISEEVSGENVVSVIFTNIPEAPGMMLDAHIRYAKEA